jgi:hypothetical protein
MTTAAAATAIEVANNFPTGSVVYDADTTTMFVPLFRYPQFYAGTALATPDRPFADTNLFGGTYGSIHHQLGQHGVAVSRKALGGDTAWRTEFLASHMAVDAFSADDGAPLQSDLNLIQRCGIEQYFLHKGRALSNSPTHCALVSTHHGLFRSHVGNSSGIATVTNKGGSSLANSAGLKPRQLDHGALVDLHDNSVKAPETSAFLMLVIPLAGKVSNGNALSLAGGLDTVDAGDGATNPSLAAAIQPDLKVRVTLFPNRAVSADPRISGSFARFGTRAGRLG